MRSLPRWRIGKEVTAELQITMGAVAQPLRVALVGSAASPSIDVTLMLVGRERTLARLAAAIALIEKG